MHVFESICMDIQTENVFESICMDKQMENVYEWDDWPPM